MTGPRRNRRSTSRTAPTMITQFVPVNEFLADKWVLGCAGDSGGDLHQGVAGPDGGETVGR
jgi:hypothetical protein